MNVFLGLFFCSLAIAETWFVRPGKTAYGGGTGKSYENAWSSFKNILWGEQGINPGDTLYICGVHEETLEVKTGGVKGKFVTIRGDYAVEKGIIGKKKLGASITFNRKNYLKIVGVEVKDSNIGVAGWNGCENIQILKGSFINLNLKGVHLFSKDPEYYCEKILISECRFVNVGQWGNSGANSLTLGNFSRDTVIENSLFIGNRKDRGVDGILIAGRTGFGSNHTIRNNKFFGHEENSIDLKHVVQSNAKEGQTKIYGNSFGGSNQIEIVIHYGTQEIDIFNNKFSNGKTAVAIVAHKDRINTNGRIKIYYNSFTDFSHGIFIDNSDKGIGENMFVNNTCINAGEANKNNYSIQVNTDFVIIKNNIFSGLSKGKKPHCPIRLLKNVDIEAIQISRNFFSNYGNSLCRFRFGAHKTKKLRDSSLKGKPNFKDEKGMDFRLAPDSKCIDKGEIVPGVHPARDLAGNDVSFDQTPDLGAYELVNKAKSK